MNTSSAYELDLRDVRGQHGVRGALEVAAAGRHNLLMMGQPGSGKTMLAMRLPGEVSMADGGVATSRKGFDEATPSRPRATAARVAGTIGEHLHVVVRMRREPYRDGQGARGGIHAGTGTHHTGAPSASAAVGSKGGVANARASDWT